MYDLIDKIKNNLDGYKSAAKSKNISMDFEKILSLGLSRKSLLTKVGELNAKRNELSKNISNSKAKPSDEQIALGKELKEKSQNIEKDLRSVEKELRNLLFHVPNIPSEDSPIGKSEDDNIATEYFGKIPKFDFKIKDHIELGTSLDILDLDRGVKVHGFRGYFLKNEGAIMHMAILFIAMQKMVKYGYTPMIPPTILKKFALENSGMIPFDDNIFKLETKVRTEFGENEKSSLYLSGTAEVPLVSYHSDEMLKESELPKKYVGFSPSYRSEVGSYGKDTKGIYRIHEFMKTEQVVICKADYDEAEKLHQEMMQISHEILDDLGLPHRYLSICTGDMGAGKYKMFDIETWMPARNAYGETHSASNITDWQSRRANIRYIDEKTGEKKFVFMLNNTALASPRILIALWENYQNSDGTITVPEILRSWIGKKKIEQKS